MTTETAHSQLVSLIEWINQRFSGLELPADTRSRIAVGCFDVALEHQAAIALLSSGALYGSLFSLIRVLFEAYVRGLWLLRCASEKELDQFQRDKLDKKFGALISEIEANVNFNNSPLSSLESTSWGAMNSFTHTGFMQVLRRNGEQTTGPHYSDEEVVKALNFSGVVGLLAAAELAGIADNRELAQSVCTKAREYAAASSNISLNRTRGADAPLAG